MKNTEITELEFGQADMPETFFKKNGSENKFRRIVFRCFIIKTEGKNILVDAGCDDMPGWRVYDFIGTVKALENMHLSPNDITDVIITHSHSDHIEGIKYFKHAHIYIQKDEFEAGKSNFSDDMNVTVFEDEYSVCDAVKAVKIASHSIGSSVVEVTNGEDKYVFAGDEFYVWDTYDQIKERMQQSDFVPESECEKRRAEFIKRYADWKVVLCHSK